MRRAFLYVYLAALTWSTIAVATKYGYLGGCSPSGVLVGRQLVAALVTVLGVAAGLYSSRVVLDARVVFLGAAVFAPFYASFYYGVDLLGVAREEVLLYTAPLWVLLYQLVFEKRRPCLRAVVASLLVLAGAALVALEAETTGVVTVTGYLVGLLSGALYAASIYLSSRLVRGLDPVSLAAGVQLWLLLGAVPIALIRGDIVVSAKCVPAILYLAVIISHVSYIFFYKGLSLGVSAHRAAVAATLELVLAIIWGFVLFNEPITAKFLLGASLVALAQLLPRG